MQLALLIGDPVAHSISPLIHNAAFREAGIEASYVATRVPTEALGSVVKGLRRSDVLGANVTIPHKATVIEHLDRLSEMASETGAVNTIVRSEWGELTGHNTDVDGFLAPLRKISVSDRCVLILGSGGAARAAAFGLATQMAPSRIVIAARSPDRSERLISDLHTGRPDLPIDFVPIEEAAEPLRSAGLVVNATPVGMHPHPDTSPWPNAKDFGPHQTVYDLVYRPRRTRLLREAGEQGACTIDGLEMLIVQAARAFELWTGREFPRHTVTRLAEQALSA